MSEQKKMECPECVDRRDFIAKVGATTAVLATASTGFAQDRPAANAQAADAPRQAPRPAESLIRELYQGLSDEQKRQVCFDWNHSPQAGQTPMRLRMVNAPFSRTIGQAYTPAQQELVQRILRSISSDEEGYRRITRNGTFDGSRNFQGCGAYIFGNPSNDQQFSWVFQGHHITVRCDGNSEPGTAFGGPIYYGHSPDGHSRRNCFYHQTQAVQSVYEALNEQQRRQATIVGNMPGEQEGSVRFRANNYPGLRSGDLTRDQRQLVSGVMREVLSPFRREDADEVMEIVGRNGGMDAIHLAFYIDRDAVGSTNWSFWRLEGPGFVWNYRVLPHVHTFVNIAARGNRGA